jgi:hypothetical protein
LKNLWIGLGALAVLGLILFVPFRGKGRAQTPSITLDWTAPGDDGVVGTATTYQMRWSSVRPDTTSQAAMDTWWASATNVTNLPTPQVSGTAQSKVVIGPFSPGTYYFLMKACDEVPNCSLYSNLASKTITDTTPPNRIIDLLAR